MKKIILSLLVALTATTGAWAQIAVTDNGDGETTGIIPIRTENGTTKADAMTFDLQGRKVAQPTQKGIYIQNGLKVVVK